MFMDVFQIYATLLLLPPPYSPDIAQNISEKGLCLQLYLIRLFEGVISNITVPCYYIN